MNFHERNVFNKCECQLVDTLDCEKCIRDINRRERLKVFSRMVLFLICVFSGIICVCALYLVFCRESCMDYKKVSNISVGVSHLGVSHLGDDCPKLHKDFDVYKSKTWDRELSGDGNGDGYDGDK